MKMFTPYVMFFGLLLITINAYGQEGKATQEDFLKAIGAEAPPKPVEKPRPPMFEIRHMIGKGVEAVKERCGGMKASAVADFLIHCDAYMHEDELLRGTRVTFTFTEEMIIRGLEVFLYTVDPKVPRVGLSRQMDVQEHMRQSCPIDDKFSILHGKPNLPLFRDCGGIVGYTRTRMGSFSIGFYDTNHLLEIVRPHLK